MTYRYPVVGLAILLVSFGAPVCSATSYYGTGWYRQLQLSIATDNNASRSEASSDRLTDSIGTARFGLGYSNTIGDAGKLILGGYLGYSNHGKIDGLSNFAATLQVRYIFQRLPGFDHPWYDTSISITRLDIHGGSTRDGYLIDGSASINRRLTGSLTGRIGYRYHDMTFIGKGAAEREADKAFDVSRHEAFVGADYEVVSNIFAFAEYSYQWGSFTTSNPGALLPGSNGYTGSTLDTAFGNSTWWAYRYQGKLQGMYFGLNVSLDKIDIEVSVRHWHARSDSGKSYPERYLQFGATWSFD